MATIDVEFSGGQRNSKLIIWLVGLTVGLFLVWANFAYLDEIVRSEGEVVPGARPQIIQNLEGGILTELMVSEGDIVGKGQILARLRTTQFQAGVDDLVEQIVAADIRRVRLEAEIAGETTFSVKPEIESYSPQIVASEKALLAARQADYRAKLLGAKAVMRESERELASMEDMLKREIVALFEVTKARKAFSDAEIRYNEVVTGTELKRANEYSQTLQELATLKQDLRLAQDQLARTVIRAPMRGVVNNLAITTIGGVVRPGEEMFQIIPVDDELFIEARVRPEDIANVRPGQTATVKFSAYDYTIYGTLKGIVDFISADTFKDERRADLPPYYRVMLRVDRSHIDQRQENIEIRPGMQTVVELHTGEKTVLDYLTKPLYRSREALREP